MKVNTLFPKRTLVEWFEQHHSLDFEPSFQRRSNLWSADKKQLLINSVLNQYDVPKFYLADFSYAPSRIQSSKKLYAVIDGKQRLQAFLDFFEDELKLGDTNIAFKGDEFLNLPGYTYSMLRQEYPTLALRYDQFIPTVMGVFTENEEEIEEMFIRLNTGISISGPERRNAMPGPVPRIIRRIVVHDFFRRYAPFRVDRGQDLNVAAKMLFIESAERIVATYSKDLDEFVLRGRSAKERAYLPAEEAVVENLSRMMRVFLESDWLLRGQAQLVTYYWFVKAIPSTRLRQSRAFLDFFENQRRRVKKETRSRGERNIPSKDRIYFDYNLSFRSPDAPIHQRRMVDILLTAFNEFNTP